MKNANVKKRAMAGLISAALVSGATVVATPSAMAATFSSAAIVDSYQALSEQELTQFYSYDPIVGNQKANQFQNTFLLPTQMGPGWCIDWGLPGPWDSVPGGYEVRKLTGHSGRFGEGLGINRDIQLAAINVTKSLIADYQQYEKRPDPTLEYRIRTQNRILQALLSNNPGALNEIRGHFYYGQLNTAMFRALTGFDIIWKKQDVTGDGTPNYVLVKNNNFRTVEENYNFGEYVTVLVPRNYNLDVNPKKNPTVQRIVTIVQPGLPGFEPKPGGGKTEVVVERPGQTETTVVTETRSATKTTQTITEAPRTVTETYTHPAVTVTERSTLPTVTRTTRVTRPVTVETKTVTPSPVTKHVTVTETTPAVTKTITEIPRPYITRETKTGKPTTVTETVSDVPVVVTKPASTVTATRWSTPTRTQVVDVPATTVTETRTVTPAPVTSTREVQITENYYTEKVYESVKEVEEFYYFAGFSQNDNSKIIEVPGAVKGSWTFEIIRGREIVDVERTDDGKLEIKPKHGFKGEGDVELLITDSEGNQYIYRIKVSDTIKVETQTNVKVNNFFYTINPDSQDRVKVIKKNRGDSVDLVYIDADGNELQARPGELVLDEDENQVKIEVTNPELRGQVIVKITEESGNVRENIVTIENTTSKFDVTREILSTSSAVIERRGGTYRIISGEDKVTVTEGDNDTWVIKPKDANTEGEVVIEFTDNNGVRYHYTLVIQKDLNSGPVIREYSIETTDTVNIERRDEWEYRVISGDIDVTAGRGKIDGKEGDVWTVKPRDGYTGQAIVHILDQKTGALIGVWKLDVNPSRQDNNFDTDKRSREVLDRAIVDIYRGSDKLEPLIQGSGKTEADLRPRNRLRFDVDNPQETYKDIIDFDRSTLGEGDWKLRFKEGAEGEVTVVEEQLSFHGNPNGEYKSIVEYTYKVSPAPVRKMEYDITSDNTLDLTGTKLRFKDKEAAKNLVAENTDLSDDNAVLKLDFKYGANGTLVIENRTEDGFLFEEYTINVKPGRNSNVKPLERVMTWNSTARIPGSTDDEYRIKEGAEFIEITRDQANNQFVITGKEGKTGTAVIEVKDARGVWAEYRLTIKEPAKGELTYQVSTNSEFRATIVNDKHTFTLAEGSTHFKTPSREGNDWVLQPKEGAAGNYGIVHETDENGKVINRYRINIVEGKSRKIHEQRSIIPVGGYTDIPKMQNGGKFEVVTGGEYVTTETVDGTFRVNAKEGTEGKLVRVEERDDNDRVLRMVFLEIVPAGIAQSGQIAPGRVNGTNVDLAEVDIVQNNNNDITINFPDDIADLILTRGAEKIREIERTDTGIIAKPVEGASGEVGYVVVDRGGNQSYQRNLTITIEDKNTQNVGSGSSEDLGKCLGALAGALSPLLLLIPVGILAQVQIPGLEGVSAQVNAAIREANDYIQRGLGIYDRERAERAAQAQGAFNVQVVNPEFIGLAAGTLGVITYGLLVADAVLRACGAGEYTSSYQIGKALDNETLMGGSSGEIPTESPKKEKTDKKGSKSETNVSVELNGNTVAESTTK